MSTTAASNLTTPSTAPTNASFTHSPYGVRAAVTSPPTVTSSSAAAVTGGGPQHPQTFGAAAPQSYTTGWADAPSSSHQHSNYSQQPASQQGHSRSSPNPAPIALSSPHTLLPLGVEPTAHGLSSPTEGYLSATQSFSRGGSFSNNGSFPHQQQRSNATTNGSGGRGAHQPHHHRNSPALRGSSGSQQGGGHQQGPAAVGGNSNNNTNSRIYSHQQTPAFRGNAASVGPTHTVPGSPMLNGSFSSKGQLFPGGAGGPATPPLRLDSPPNNAAPHTLQRTNSGVSSRGGNGGCSTPGSALIGDSSGHGYALPAAVAIGGSSHNSFYNQTAPSASAHSFSPNPAALPSYIPHAFATNTNAPTNRGDMDPLSRSDRLDASLNRSEMLSGSFSRCSIGPISTAPMSAESPHIVAPIGDVSLGSAVADSPTTCAQQGPPFPMTSGGGIGEQPSMPMGGPIGAAMGGTSSIPQQQQPPQHSLGAHHQQRHPQSMHNNNNAAVRRRSAPSSLSQSQGSLGTSFPSLTQLPAGASLPTHMMGGPAAASPAVGSSSNSNAAVGHQTHLHASGPSIAASSSAYSSATEDRESMVSGSSSSSIRDDLPLCENDQGCTLINDKRHQRQFAHTCRLVPCYHAHVKRHAKLFRHAPGQLITVPDVTPASLSAASASGSGASTSGAVGGHRSGKQSQRATLALASVNFNHISPDAPNAIPVTVSARNTCYEIFGDWTQVKLHTFKRYLNQCFKVLPIHQRLYLDTVAMDDDLRSVASYGVVARSTITLRADDEDGQGDADEDALERHRRHDLDL